MCNLPGWAAGLQRCARRLVRFKHGGSAGSQPWRRVTGLMALIQFTAGACAQWPGARKTLQDHATCMELGRGFAPQGEANFDPRSTPRDKEQLVNQRCPITRFPVSARPAWPTEAGRQKLENHMLGGSGIFGGDWLNSAVVCILRVWLPCSLSFGLNVGFGLLGRLGRQTCLLDPLTMTK